MSDTRKDEAASNKDAAIREAMRLLGDDIIRRLEPDDRLSQALSEKYVGEKDPD